MNTSTATKVFFFFILGFVLLGIMAYLWPAPETSTEVKTSEAKAARARMVVPANEPVAPQHEETVITPYPPFEETLNPQELAEFTDVYENSVWINREAQAYPYYDTDTLKAMADNGDIRAMQEIVYQLIHNGSNSEKYAENPGKWLDEHRKYVTMAIIHGDRELLSMGEDIFVDQPEPDQGAKEALLSSLAYSEFMAIRGNTDSKYTYARDAIHAYTEKHGPLLLTDNDKSTIYLRAEKIYQDVENKRLQAGLPPFDNSIPDYILALKEHYPSLYSDEAQKQRLLGENGF